MQPCREDRESKSLGCSIICHFLYCTLRDVTMCRRFGSRPKKIQCLSGRFYLMHAAGLLGFRGQISLWLIGGFFFFFKLFIFFNNFSVVQSKAMPPCPLTTSSFFFFFTAHSYAVNIFPCITSPVLGFIHGFRRILFAAGCVAAVYEQHAGQC